MALALTSEDTIQEMPVKDPEPEPEIVPELSLASVPTVVAPEPMPEPSEDLEDGEIEDDDDDEPEPATVPEPEPAELSPPKKTDKDKHKDIEPPREDKDIIKHDKDIKDAKHKKKHLTEAEKSVMKLHKMERIEREKRDKYRRDHTMVDAVDDYAVSLEKALAKVLRKEKGIVSEEEKEEEVKRGRKRKKKIKHKKNKKNKLEVLKQEEPISPEDFKKTDEESTDSETSSDKGDRKRHNRNMQQQEKNKNRRERRERSRERANDKIRFQKMRKRNNVGICLYYLQGKCIDEHCQYSHDCVQPLKLELCKFYLLDCCAKGDKCLYMHSDFPCKYYHTGIPCPFGDDCKFAHGGPLPESVKQILFKHIETAPKEILGNFPRLSRENAHMMITQAQKNLDQRKQKEKEEAILAAGGTLPPREDSQGERSESDTSTSTPNIKGDKKEKRNRPSRWQDPEPDNSLQQQQQQQQQQVQNLIASGGFAMNVNLSMKPPAFTDQDMRINNGDVDMRSLQLPTMHQSIHPTDIVNPNIFTTKPPPILPPNLNLQNLNLQNLQNLQMLQQPGMNFNLLNANLLAQSLGPPPTFIPPPAIPVSMPVPISIAAPSTTLTSPIPIPTTATMAMTMAPTPEIRPDVKNEAVDIEQYKMDALSKTTIATPPVVAEQTTTSFMATECKDEEPIVSIPKDFLLSCDKDTDIRMQPVQLADVDIRQQVQMQVGMGMASDTADEEENSLQIDLPTDEEEPKTTDTESSPMPSMAKTQRDLFQRIQQQQRFNAPVQPQGKEEETQQEVEPEIDWYSDDEDDNKLTIEHEDEDDKEKEKEKEKEEPKDESKKGILDLSKIDISAEVSKLLSSMQQNSQKPSDPRTKPESRDPRLARATDTKPEPVTIYEQSETKDVDLRSGRSDVDLRSLDIPFKSMANYTPASEIDASIAAHPVMTWKVYIVEVPKPDYTGLKLSSSDAASSGDPRLRKIFRLSIDEKDSPASPGSSPKAVSAPVPRMDPRKRRAMEAAAEKEQMQQPLTYAQQLTTLQASPFYLSLTSNQKLMLNQELASRNDQTGMSDPIMTAMLSNLGLQASQQQMTPTPQQTGQALNILNNLNVPGPATGNFQNPMLGVGVGVVCQPNMGQGLLGPAPPLLQGNIQVQDFPLGYANNAALLGNAPNAFNQDFNPNVNVANIGGNYNEEFYDQGRDNSNNSSCNRFNQNQNNQNNRERNNRRGRNNGNNRNSNNNNRNYFRRQHNRNRNSPS